MTVEYPGECIASVALRMAEAPRKRLHFGLGSAKQIERIEVRWPSGQVDTLTDVTIDQRIEVTEGRGQR